MTTEETLQKLSENPTENEGTEKISENLENIFENPKTLTETFTEPESTQKSSDEHENIFINPEMPAENTPVVESTQNISGDLEKMFDETKIAPESSTEQEGTEKVPEDFKLIFEDSKIPEESAMVQESSEKGPGELENIVEGTKEPLDATQKVPENVVQTCVDSKVPIESTIKPDISQKVSEDLENLFETSEIPPENAQEGSENVEQTFVEPKVPHEGTTDADIPQKVSEHLKNIFDIPKILPDSAQESSENVEKMFVDPEVPSESPAEPDVPQKVSEHLENIFETPNITTESTTNISEPQALQEEKHNLLDELEKVIEEKAKEIQTGVQETPDQTIEDKLKEIVGDDSFDQLESVDGSKVSDMEQKPFFDAKGLNFELEHSDLAEKQPNLDQKEPNFDQKVDVKPFFNQEELHFELESSGIDPNLNQKGSECTPGPVLIKIEPVGSTKLHEGPDLGQKNSAFLKELDLEHTGPDSQKAEPERQKIIPIIKKIVPEYQINISGNLVRVSVSGENANLNSGTQKSGEEKENLGKTISESRRVIEKRSVVLERRFKEEEESLLVEMPVPEIETPKRKRGRPRKNVVDPDPPFSPFSSAKKKTNAAKRLAPPVSPETNGEPKKKRGRPRKNLGFGFHNIVAEVKNIKLPSSKWSVHINPGAETRQVCFTKSELKNGDSSTPVVDRLVKFMGGKNFYVKINNKLVELIGSPKTVESLEDVEILLTIVNDIKSNDSLIKSYIR